MFELALPLAVFVQRQRKAGIFSVSQQVDGDKLGTHGVVVVLVVPNLFHLNGVGKDADFGVVIIDIGMGGLPQDRLAGIQIEVVKGVGIQSRIRSLIGQILLRRCA